MENPISDSGGAANRKKSAGRRFVLFALCGNLLLFTLIGYLVLQDYRKIEQDAHQHAETLVRLVSQYVESDYRTIDLALQGIVDEAASPHAPVGAEMDLWLRKVRSRHPILNVLRITDAAGEVRYGADPPPGVKVNLADRDYFIRSRDDANAGLQISGPLFGKTTGRKVIALARRMNDANGKFVGVVVGSVDLDRLAERLSRLGLRPGDAIALRGPDLQIVVRHPAQPGSLPASSARPPAFDRALATNPERGQFDSGPEDGDGVVRINSYRRNPAFGFYVEAGLARSEVFVTWRQQASALGVVVLWFALLASWLAWRLRRSWIDLALTNQHLAAKEAHLLESQRIARLGNFAFDLRSENWESSPTLDEIFGIDASAPHDQAGWQSLIHPEDRAAAVQHVRTEVLEQGRPLNMEFRIVLPSGELRWVHARGQLVRQGPTKAPVVRGSIQDITEQKSSEISLRKLNKLLDTAGQIARFGGWSIDLPSMALTWTKETYQLHDLPPDAPVTVETAIAFYTPAAQPLISAAVQAAIADGTPWDLELALTSASGRSFWARVYGQAERLDGKTVRVFGAILDITEQRQIANELRASQARFQSFFDSAMVGMAVTSPEKGWVMVNPALCEILGYSKEVLVTKTWTELTHPDDLVADVAQFDRVIAGEIDGYSLEKRFVRPDGQIVDAFMAARAVRKADGQVDFFSASVQNISQRKAAERSLRQMQDLLEAAGRTAKFGGWAVDLPALQLTWSDEVYRIHEMVPGTPLSVAQSIGFYAPLSRERIAAAVQAGIDHGTPWDMELQLVTATGRTIWTRAIGQAEMVGGKAVRLYGSFTDIDAQKNAAIQLAENERRLRLLAENTAAYIYELDVDGTIAFANRVYAGLTQTEVIGTKITDWFPVTQRASISSALAQAISHRQPQTLEYEIPDPDGVLRSYEARLMPVVADDRVCAVVLTANDMTERKQFERQLMNSRELLRQFLDHFPGLAYVKDENLHMLMASAAFKSQMGLNPVEMIGKSSAALFGGEFREFGEKMISDDRRVLASEVTETIEESWGGKTFETTRFVIRQQDSRVLGGLTIDVTQRVRNRLRTEALLALSSVDGTLPERDFLREGLLRAETLTGSEIGFLHFVNEDQETIELVTWTDGALKGCQAAYDAHYPISQAGIWADCFRKRGPVMFNDYAAYAEKKGLPPGHARLDRLLSVPVIENGAVRMMMGVGNKPADYDDFDVQTVQLIGNDLWRVVRRQRAERELKDRLAELLTMNQKLTQAQDQLLQSEKMATIGQLAAGVAHELNNPIGFIQSNLGTLQGYVEDLLAIIDETERCADACTIPGRFERLKALKAETDLTFLRQDVRDLLAESRDGTDRVRNIVQNLKDFSHVSEDEWVWADLHQGLDSTLRLVWNEVKYKAEVEKRYGTLPPVFCLASQLNQVFMNLLVNAAQAIETQGKITLLTGVEAGDGAPQQVWIEVRDTGKGIPPENLQRIFDPFFTTKPVGKGTGLGLSLAWSIVQKHHGILSAESKVGVGTTFRITLPVVPVDGSGNTGTPPK